MIRSARTHMPFSEETLFLVVYPVFFMLSSQYVYFISGIIGPNSFCWKSRSRACMPGDATLKSPHHEEYSSSDFQHAFLNKFYHQSKLRCFILFSLTRLLPMVSASSQLLMNHFGGARAAECAKLLSREAWPWSRQHNVMDTCPEIKITSTPPPVES